MAFSFTNPCVQGQIRAAWQTMSQTVMECGSLWIGMCVLTQVTKLNSVPAPSDKNMPFWNPPGEAFCVSVHYIAVTCLSAGRDEMKLLWVASFMALTFNDSYYTQSFCVMTHSVMQQFSKVSKLYLIGSHPDLCFFFLSAGSAYYDNVRPLAYPDADAVLICFDVSRPETLDSVTKKVSIMSTQQQGCVFFNC